MTRRVLPWPHAGHKALQIGKIKLVSSDYDEGALESIDKGVIAATVGQGTWHMGCVALTGSG